MMVHGDPDLNKDSHDCKSSAFTAELFHILLLG